MVLINLIPRTFWNLVTLRDAPFAFCQFRADLPPAQQNLAPGDCDMSVRARRLRSDCVLPLALRLCQLWIELEAGGGFSFFVTARHHVSQNRSLEESESTFPGVFAAAAGDPSLLNHQSTSRFQHHDLLKPSAFQKHANFPWCVRPTRSRADRRTGWQTLSPDQGFPSYAIVKSPRLSQT